MILPLKPPFILGIFHCYVSHNQMVIHIIHIRRMKRNATWSPKCWCGCSKLTRPVYAMRSWHRFQWMFNEWFGVCLKMKHSPLIYITLTLWHFVLRKWWFVHRLSPLGEVQLGSRQLYSCIWRTLYCDMLHNFVMNNMMLAILGSVQQAFADHTISSFNLLSQQVNEAAIN